MKTSLLHRRIKALRTELERAFDSLHGDNRHTESARTRIHSARIACDQIAGDVTDAEFYLERKAQLQRSMKELSTKPKTKRK